MLRLKPYEGDCKAVGLDDTIRINHTDCPAGEDTRRRLYLTRHAHTPGIVLGYCHNCSEGSVLSVDTVKYKSHSRIAPAPDEAPSILGSDALDDDMWQAFGCADDTYLKGLNPIYDAHTGRINIPIFQGTDYIGYNSRRYKGVGAKYILHVKKDWNKTAIYNPYKEKTIVFVEDQVSAMALSIAGYIGVSIFGSNINPETLFSCLKETSPDRVVVWLDNDNQQVKDNASKIQRNLQLMVPLIRVKNMNVSTDPKKYSVRELQFKIEGMYR